MREHHATKDDLFHECINELPEEIEQGEETATYYTGFLIDGRKDKSRGFASDTKTVKLDAVEDRVQGYQAKPPNEKGFVEVPGPKTNRTDRFLEHPEIPKYQEKPKDSRNNDLIGQLIEP
jgi:hypothetical protein